MSPLDPAQFQALMDAVVAAFDQDELAKFVRLKLGKRLDVLVNTDKPFEVQVFKLIEHSERHGWTEEFIRGVHEERPTQDKVQQYVKAHAAFVLTPPPSAPELARTVKTGLMAVRARDADAFRGARARLTAVSTQFGWLRQYKALHDCLHELQIKYVRQITAGLRALPEEADNLGILFKEMSKKLQATRPAAVGLESAALEEDWLNEAEEAVRQMRAGVAAGDGITAQTWFQLLQRVVWVQPSRINEQLTGVLGALPLDPLRNAVLELGDENAAEAAAALGSLTPRKNRILDVHKEWQRVDNTLRAIESDLKLGLSLETPAFQWERAAQTLRRILNQDRVAAWSEELGQLAAELSRAFTTANLEVVRIAFREVRLRAMWSFYQADLSLKELTEELVRIGTQLDLILTGVANGPS